MSYHSQNRRFIGPDLRRVPADIIFSPLTWLPLALFFLAVGTDSMGESKAATTSIGFVHDFLKQRYTILALVAIPTLNAICIYLKFYYTEYFIDAGGYIEKNSLGLSGRRVDSTTVGMIVDSEVKKPWRYIFFGIGNVHFRSADDNEANLTIIGVGDPEQVRRDVLAMIANSPYGGPRGIV